MMQYGHKGPEAREPRRLFIGTSDGHDTWFGRRRICKKHVRSFPYAFRFETPSVWRPHCLAERRAYTTICHADR